MSLSLTGQDRPLRVAMFSDYYPPHVGGGVEKVVKELAHGLTERDVEMDVFTFRTAGGSSFENAGNLRIHRYRAFDLTRTLKLQSAISPQMLKRTFQTLKHDPPDVLHAHNTFFFSSLVAAGLAKWLKRPLVTTLHLGELDALPVPQRLPVMAYERSLGRAIVAASQHLIAVSQAVADYAVSHGAAPNKITVQPNAVDSDAFQPATQRHKGPPRIAFVGRLIQNKGPQYLVEAVPELARAVPGVEVWFIGDGPMRASLEARTRALDVEESVQFFGTREDVDQLLQAVDIFARPSLMEGLPLTVLEAMATGLPVVATPVGGTPEVVKDGTNGLLVPPSDVDALAQALIRLATNPGLRQQLGVQGRQYVEQDHGWQRIVEDTISLYNELAGKREEAPERRLRAA